jgi:hypothetical protein
VGQEEAAELTSEPVQSLLRTGGGWRRIAVGTWATRYFSRKHARLICGASPTDCTLGRLVMMMHVMFVDVHFVDKRGDHDCDVVREII